MCSGHVRDFITATRKFHYANGSLKCVADDVWLVDMRRWSGCRRWVRKLQLLLLLLLLLQRVPAVLLLLLLARELSAQARRGEGEFPSACRNHGRRGQPCGRCLLARQLHVWRRSMQDVNDALAAVSDHLGVPLDSEDAPSAVPMRRHNSISMFVR